jgi:hypothetical protein
MRNRKSLILSLAFLVGVGLMGSAEKVYASANEIAVSIVSPDSGKTLGIDGAFVAKATVTHLPGLIPNDSLAVVFYLATTDSTVMTDTTNNAATFTNVDFTAGGAQNAVILAGARKTALVTADGGATTGIVAVQQKRKRGSTAHSGDGDSVAVDASTTTQTVFTWYGKLHASSGTVVSGVTVKAWAIDSLSVGVDTTTVATSSAKLGADGDRPANPQAFIDKAGINLSTSLGKVDEDDVTGEVTVLGFNNIVGNNHSVLNIGDTLTVRAKLGAGFVPLLQDTASKLIARVFKKDHLVHQSGTLVAPSSGDTMTFSLVLAEGQYGDLNASAASGNTDILAFHVVDPAGNLSSTNKDNVIPEGSTAATTLLFDTKKPTLDGAVVAGDTLLPAIGDTISDGTFNTGFLDDGAGNNPDAVLSWSLAEALEKLVIEFGAKDTVTVTNTTRLINHPSLLAGSTRYVDFTALGSSGTRHALVGSETSGDRTAISAVLGTGAFDAGAAVGDSIVTGLYDFTFTPTDVAGNAGDAVTRSGVYVDLDNVILDRLFPTKGAFGHAAHTRIDTLNGTTADVVFAMSEPVDSLNITYKGIEGTAKDSIRVKTLSGSELTKLTEQKFDIGLIDSSKYTLIIQARDLAGNWIQTDPDTFYYASGFQELLVQSFAITATKSGKETADHLLVGQTNTLTLIAKAKGGKDANTYSKNTILTVTGGRGLTATGAGVRDTTTTLLNAKSWVLGGTEWVVGKRTVTLKNTTSRDTLVVSLLDTTTKDTAGVSVTGKLDSAVVYDPEIYSRIWVGLPPDASGLTQNKPFWVDVVLQDKFNNTRDLDTRTVEITSNKVGIDHSDGAISIKNGKGGFWATSQWAGDGLVFSARDIVRVRAPASYPANSDDLGKDFLTGFSPPWAVLPPAMMALAMPDTLVAEDYMGALGAGDNGGFVMLTFPVPENSMAQRWRVWRGVVVKTGLSEGKLVSLTPPDTTLIPWGTVAKVPGLNLMHIVVATLDNVPTKWGVTAEMGGRDKQAFASVEGMVDPYELMSQTMVESKKIAQLELKPNTPVFASLTPEALAFIDGGIVSAPRMKETDDGVIQSEIVITAEAVAAIDNIAPEPVPFLQVFDTPNDAGGSITVTWVKSESDLMLSRSFGGAVGPSTADAVLGVKGYNIYRSLGDGPATLVGNAGPGETSFVDITAFNGGRYTYSVSPYDEDNITAASLTRTAMPIRNRVFDSSGGLIVGLFGPDNQVGFDDFFIFADRFGLQAGDENFDPAFDLSVNNRIDFNDFFLFGDNFGRVAVGVSKAVPMTVGLNSDARLDLYAVEFLPRIGEEMVLNVSLADFVELKGYGFTVNYDASTFEFIRAEGVDNLLGGTELAQPQVLAETAGEVSIGGYGEAISEGELGVSLIFRPIAETEQSLIELTRGELGDDNYALNSVASLGAIEIETRPEVYALGNNYPNPFNPATTIKYQLPEATDVRLEIFNVVGQVVRTLIADPQNAGRYTVQWDAANDSGQPLSSGIYFYRLQAGEFQEVNKMLLLK